MATQSGQGMRDQGSMAQGIWNGPQGPQGQRPVPGGPQGVREGVDYRQGRQPQGPPQGIQQGPPGAPPPVPFQGFGPQGFAQGELPPGTPSTMPVGQGVPYQQPGAPQAPQGPAAAPGAPAPSRGPVPAGTKDPFGGAPVNPDGSYQRSDGTVDWLPGYGPQRDYGAMGMRTGQQPTRPGPPEPDSVAPRGTAQWRQAYAQHDAWIQEQIGAGRSLADLGFEPTRGGGLSIYSRYGGAGGPGDQLARQAGARNPTPNAPPRAPGPGTGGFLPGTEGDLNSGFGGGMSYAGQGFGGGLQNAILQLLMGGRGNF